MEVMVKSKFYSLIIVLIFGLGFSPAFAQVKIGYTFAPKSHPEKYKRL